MKLKKVLALVLALALVVSAFAACSGGNTTSSGTTESSTPADNSGEESTPAEDNGGESTPDDTGAADIIRGSGAVLQEAQSYGDKETLNFRIGMEPTSMNTLQVSYSDEFTMVNNLYEMLLRMDPDDHIEGAAAESWDVSEDGLTYTFHLRNNNHWTNGDTVLAEDFEFAWEKLLNPATASQYAYFLFFVENGEAYNKGECEWADVGVKAVDDFTLEVKLHTALPYAEELFMFGSLAPVNKSFYEAVGEDLYGTEPEYYCSNGAFAMIEWSHGEKIVVQKNPGYHDADRVSIGQITFKIIENAESVLASFLAGDIDYSGTVSSGDAIKQLQDAGYEVHQFQSSAIFYMRCNVQNEYLQNVNLRKALGLAFDKEAVIRGSLNNGSLPLQSFVAPVTLVASSGANLQEAVFAANGGEPLYPANGDVEKAKEYFGTALSELGIDASALNSLAIDCSNDTNSIAMASMIQEQWRVNLGIEVSVNPKQTSQLAEDYENHNFDFSISGWAPDYNDPISDLDLWTSDGGNNSTGWSNEEYDALIAEAQASTDPKQRLQNFVRCEQILEEEYPILPIYNRMTSYAIGDKVKGGFIITANQTTYRFVELG